MIVTYKKGFMDLKQANTGILYFVLKPLYKKTIKVEWNKRLLLLDDSSQDSWKTTQYYHVRDLKIFKKIKEQNSWIQAQIKENTKPKIR